MSKEKAKLLREQLNQDLMVLMSANKIVSPNGEIEIDMQETLALFNVLKPIITRKAKAVIKREMESRVENSAQIDISDAIDSVSEEAAEQLVKSTAKSIAKTRK